MAMSGGLTEVAILFSLVLYIIVAMGWPCQSEKGKAFQTDSCPNYTPPPPPHKVHINKNININDIGGQNNNMYFLAEFVWK